MIRTELRKKFIIINMILLRWGWWRWRRKTQRRWQRWLLHSGNVPRQLLVLVGWLVLSVAWLVLGMPAGPSKGGVGCGRGRSTVLVLVVLALCVVMRLCIILPLGIVLPPANLPPTTLPWVIATPRPVERVGLCSVHIVTIGWLAAIPPSPLVTIATGVVPSPPPS